MLKFCLSVILLFGLPFGWCWNTRTVLVASGNSDVIHYIEEDIALKRMVGEQGVSIIGTCLLGSESVRKWIAEHGCVDVLFWHDTTFDGFHFSMINETRTAVRELCTDTVLHGELTSRTLIEICDDKMVFDATLRRLGLGRYLPKLLKVDDVDWTGSVRGKMEENGTGSVVFNGFNEFQLPMYVRLQTSQNSLGTYIAHTLDELVAIVDSEGVQKSSAFLSEAVMDTIYKFEWNVNFVAVDGCVLGAWTFGLGYDSAISQQGSWGQEHISLAFAGARLFSGSAGSLKDVAHKVCYLQNSCNTTDAREEANGTWSRLARDDPVSRNVHVIQLLQQFTKSLNYTGVGCLQIKFQHGNPTDPRIIENNPRFCQAAVFVVTRLLNGVTTSPLPQLLGLLFYGKDLLDQHHGIDCTRVHPKDVVA